MGKIEEEKIKEKIEEKIEEMIEGKIKEKIEKKIEEKINKKTGLAGCRYYSKYKLVKDICFTTLNIRYNVRSTYFPS